MSISTKQANFLLPEDLLNELKKNVSKRQLSKVVTNAIRKELKSLKLKNALQTSFGVWKDEDHPELKPGAEEFVRSMRKSTRSNRNK